MVVSVSLSPSTQVWTLAPDDQFIYLCTHGAISGWFRLKGLADIAALLAQHPPAAVERLFYIAIQVGAERAVGQAILLCVRLFRTRIPETLLTRLRRDGVVVRLEQVGLGSLMLGGVAERHTLPFGTMRSALSRFSLRRGLRYKFRELALSLTNPFEATLVPYPDSLLFLYPLARPLIWLSIQLRAWHHRKFTS